MQSGRRLGAAAQATWVLGVAEDRTTCMAEAQEAPTRDTTRSLLPLFSYLAFVKLSVQPVSAVRRGLHWTVYDALPWLPDP